MTALLTLLEYYLRMRDIQYLRLDGSTKSEDRGDLLKKFNAPESPYFIFILSTRAGGLGLNLQTADTVIIFDSDWNPQMDLQAQDRAHRIGQSKEVRVLRLITVSSVEEKILERANFKLDMDQKIIEAGMFNSKAKATERSQMLISLLREDHDVSSGSVVPTEAEINRMIARDDAEYELFQKMDKEREESELDDWINVGNDGPLPARLMQMDELPAWLLNGNHYISPQKRPNTGPSKFGRYRRLPEPDLLDDEPDDDDENDADWLENQKDIASDNGDSEIEDVNVNVSDEEMDEEYN
jgi:hypothetical protein